MYVHGKQRGKGFPALTPVICRSNVRAAVIAGTIPFAVLRLFFGAGTESRCLQSKLGKKFRCQTGVVQVIDGKLHQIIMAYIGVIKVVEALTEPVRKLRKFLQMTGMESGIRVLCCICQRIGEIFIQIAPLFDAVCLFQFLLCQGNCVSAR